MVSWILMYALTTKNRPPVMETMSTKTAISKEDCVVQAQPEWQAYYLMDTRLVDLHTFCLESNERHPKRNMIWNIRCAPEGNCQVI
jgi:hypothetical protein